MRRAVGFLLPPSANLGRALAAGALLAASTAAGADVRKLSGKPLLGVSGDVKAFALSPDDRLVVYRADQEHDEVFELYSVPVDSVPAGGGRSTRLNGPLVAGSDVASFQITADSKHVVFLADQDTDERVELYAMPTNGAAVAPTKLGGTLVAQGDVYSFQLAQASGRVVFLADRDTDEVFELYSAPVLGGAVSKLNAPLAAGDVLDFRISPDGSRVVYRAGSQAPASGELFSVAIEGGAAIALDAPITPPGTTPTGSITSANDYVIDAFSAWVYFRTVATQSSPWFPGQVSRVPLTGGDATALAADATQFKLSPDAGRLVFTSFGELYSVPASGGAATHINHPLDSIQDVLTFRISPDSTRVAYSLLNGDSYTGAYSVPIEGGPVFEFPTEGEVIGLSITPDSSRIVFEQTTGDTYSAPLDGGERVHLFGYSDGFLIAPDSSRVLFVSSYEISSVPIAGGATTQINAPLPYDGGHPQPVVSADSQHVLFVAARDSDGVSELFVAPLAGGSATKLNPPLARGGRASDVHGVVASPDRRFVLYTADLERDEVVELFAVDLAHDVTTRLNPALVSGGDVRNVLISPDSAHVVYSADQEQDDVVELFRVSPAGGTPLRLNRPLDAGGDVIDARITADSRTVLYMVGELGTAAVPQLFAVPITGGPSVELSQPPGSDSTLLSSDLAISADSTRVVYRTRESSGSIALYTVPIAGGTPLRLNPDAVPGGSVGRFEILADGSAVVYVGDLDTDQVFELYRTPLAGGPTTKLNAPLGPGLFVYAFRASADSRYVVYQESTNQLGAERDLTSVRLADLARVRVTPFLFPGRRVDPFKISADSTRVIYRSDQDRGSVYELWSVPIEGGLAVRLNPPLPTFGDVDYYFAPTADSSWVVFRANTQLSVHELFAAPLDGTSSSRRLGAVPAAVSVQTFDVASDSRSVLYTVSQAPDPSRRELFATDILVPNPEKLNPPLEPGGGVSGYQLLRAGSVLYVADQELDETYELYLYQRRLPQFRAR